MFISSTLALFFGKFFQLLELFLLLRREKHSIFMFSWANGLLSFALRCCQMWIIVRFAPIDHPATKQTLFYTCATLIRRLFFFLPIFLFYLSSMCTSFNHKLKIVEWKRLFAIIASLITVWAFYFDSAAIVCVCFSVNSRTFSSSGSDLFDVQMRAQRDTHTARTKENMMWDKKERRVKPRKTNCSTI